MRTPLRGLLVLLIALAPAAVPAQAGGARAGVGAFEQAHYAEAKAQLAAAAKANPRDAEAAFYLGRVAMVEGAFDEAARRFESAVKIQGRDAEYHRWLGRAYAQQAIRGSKLHAMFLAGKIRGHFESAVALDSNDVDARMDLIGFLVTAPGVAGGSMQRAGEQARAVAARNPYRGHIAAALVTEKRDPGGAEREYRAAIATAPDSVEAPYALGLLYQRIGQPGKALATFEGLLREHPDATNALYAIGRLAAQTGKYLERGEQALRQYLDAPLREGNPPLASAHYRLGTIYERTGRRELARREYESSLALEDRPEVREALGRVR